MPGRLISSLFSFKGLYAVFAIAIIFYGNMYVFSGVTPRHIATIVMIAACFRNESHLFLNRIIGFYLLFIISFGISSFITGYSVEYLTLLFSNYLVCIVAYWATKNLIIRYNGMTFFLNLFIVLGTLDGVITICQTFGFALADNIMKWLHLYSAQEYMVELNEKRASDLDYLDSMDSFDDTMSSKHSLSLMTVVIPGAFNSGVANGYFLMTTGVISLKLLIQRFGVIRLIPWLICILGCICVQERGPIVILAVLSFYALYKFISSRQVKKNKLSILILIPSLIAIINFVYKLISNLGSRITEIGLEDKGREDIYGDALNYYFDHPFFGGYHQFTHELETAPHNLILNAFIYGGIIGGLAIVAILFIQFKPIIKVFWQRINRKQSLCFIAALAYTAYTLNSLLHNRSIVTGDVIIWMLWAAFYYSYKLSKQRLK